MRTGLVASTVAHAGLIVLAIIGIGMGKPMDPTPVESIAVDLVPISEFSNIRLGSLDSKIVQTETPSVVQDVKPAELAQPTGNTAEDQPKPEDTPTPTPAPTKETAPAPESAQPVVAPDPVPAPDAAPTPVARPVAEPVPEPDPAPVVEPAPDPVAPDPALATPQIAPDAADAAPKPLPKTTALEQKRAEFKKQVEADKKRQANEKQQAEEQAKAVAEAKAAADAKKAADKKKADEKKRIEQAKADAAKPVDDVANIINNEQSRGATTGEGGEPTLGKQDGRSATLSQSQLDGLASQIRECVVMPAGAEDAGATAEVQFTVGGDGSVVGQPRVLSSPTSQVEDAYSRAVTRAVMRCGPYTLVAGQDVRAQFRARE